ncbi:UBX domain-containing protein 11 [Pholidichthys leucotaenia]
MSSPLSMLKKTRRPPLQGLLSEKWDKQKVPFKRNLLREFQAALVSDDTNPPASDPSTSKSTPPLKGAPPSDFELMSAMMQRVSLLEKTVRSQREEIKHKDKRISVLEEELQFQKQSGSTHGQCGREELERRCEELQSQVYEMENFLSDYGLTWVGDEEARGPVTCEWTQQGRSFNMDFDLVLQRIRELNVLVGEGVSFVQTTATRAQLAKKDPIQLRLYSNGIVMFDGPFRSYQENSTQECMQDLMDGYFPSELQERFPDGVPFEVHDRRDEEFIFRPPWDTFPGEGHTVGGERDESSATFGSQKQGKKVKLQQLLNKLPKVVIKAGRVIDIRTSLRETMLSSSDAQTSSSVILINTPALQAVTDRVQTLSDGQPPPAHEVITLKVKSEDGSQTYLVKMCLSETIGQLRKYLNDHRGGSLPGYDIISVYPHCNFDDDGQTLQSCGLATNATVLLQKRSSPSKVNKPMQDCF